MAYIRYKGSPDVFDETTGRYISDVEAQKIANFDTQVKDVNVIRPDIQTEADFAKLSGTNVALSPTPTPTAPSTSPVSPEDKPYVEATNPPVTPQSPEQPQNNQQPIQDKTLANVAPGGQIPSQGGIPDATLPTQGQQPVQVGGKFGTQQFGRLGNDVYEIMSDGSRRKVTEAEFNQKLKAQGLNLDVLPQLTPTQSYQDQAPSGPPPPSSTPTAEPDDVTKKIAEYQAIFKALGVSDLKSIIETNKKEYQDLQDKKSSEILDVNDDPWASEELRQRRVKKINDKYELKENTLSNQLKLYDSLLEEGLAQAKFVATGIWDDRNKLLDLAQKREEALTKLAGADYDLREVDGSLYRVDKKTGKSELLIKGSPTGDGALTSAQMNATINQIAGSFDNEPIVKEYNTISGNVNFIKTAGTTPTDDISRIYAFAKVMDPNSVVREGEYDTVQKYSQALLEQYGLKAKRVFDNSGFLTTEARKFLQDTLERRLKTSEQQYKQVQTQYQNRIANVKAGGFNTLTDYSGAFKNQSNPEQDIIDTIREEKGKYKTREDLLNALIPVFPEFDLDEIGYYVYTQIPD